MNAHAKLPRIVAPKIYSFDDDGSLIDIAQPDPAVICFHSAAVALSGIRRFNGRGIPVTQHLVIGADSLLREGESRMMAALYLLHDVHEYIIGDIITPTGELIATVDGGGDLIKLAKAGWDRAIYTAANLPPPDAWTTVMRRTVKSMDERMCRAESLNLFGPRSLSRFREMELPSKAIGATWLPMQAEAAFINACERLLGADIVQFARERAEAARLRRKK